MPKVAESQKLEASSIPFGTNLDGARYQQVYDAALFSGLPSGGGFISDVYLRPGCDGNNGSTFSNLVVRMSTTLRQAGGLSRVFNDNLGSDVLEVTDRSAVTIQGNLAHQSCYNEWGLVDVDWKFTLSLNTPFFYDPSKGNLIMDLQIPAHELGVSGGDRLWNEVTRTLLDGTSSMFAKGINAGTAEIISETGLVTAFVVAPFPRLSAILTDTSLFLSWPSKPSPVRLQRKESIDLRDQWRDVDGAGIKRGELTSILELPRVSLRTNSVFRLYWLSPQIGLAGVTSRSDN